MRGTSAQSQEQLVATVEDALRDDGDASALGDELFSLVDVLDAQPSLRRILTDPAASADAKSGLIRELFGDRISSAASEVLTAAATARWSGSRDMSDALELAGVTAHLIGAQAADQLDEVEDELFRFGRLAQGNPELRAVLSDRGVDRDRKRELVRGLLDGRTTPWTVSLASQAVVARQRSFEASLAEMGEVAAGRRQQLVASVRSAYELEPQERQRLADALSHMYGKPVHLNVVVDPSVLGGLSVEVGDEIVDATVSARLQDAHRRIAG